MSERTAGSHLFCPPARQETPVALGAPSGTGRGAEEGRAAPRVHLQAALGAGLGGCLQSVEHAGYVRNELLQGKGAQLSWMVSGRCPCPVGCPTAPAGPCDEAGRAHRRSPGWR